MSNRIAVFEKLSLEKFIEEETKNYELNDESRELLTDMHNSVKVPVRATSGSAGYDFFCPCEVKLKAGEEIVIPTCIRCNIDDGWVLAIVPKSGLGFKYKVSLANTIGIIDSDYYYSDNDGHIKVKIVNGGNHTLVLNPGDKFCQGIFLPYGITKDDAADGIRNGGFGSTGA